MLAGLGHRDAERVSEQIDSMELAWLVHQAEERYGVTLDLTDDAFARMSTVDGAVEVLHEALREAGGG
jgi:acyl carrier protein